MLAEFSDDEQQCQVFAGLPHSPSPNAGYLRLDIPLCEDWMEVNGMLLISNPINGSRMLSLNRSEDHEAVYTSLCEIRNTELLQASISVNAISSSCLLFDRVSTKTIAVAHPLIHW